MNNFQQIRSEMAQELRNTPKEERRSKLEELRNSPEYVIAYYSRKEGRDLGKHELAESLYSQTTESYLSKEAETKVEGAQDIEKLIRDLRELIKLPQSEENLLKIAEIKKEILEVFSSLNSYLQEMNSNISFAKIAMFDMRSARILFESLSKEPGLDPKRLYEYKDKTSASYIRECSFDISVSDYSIKMIFLRSKIRNLSKILEDLKVFDANKGSIFQREFSEVPSEFISVYQRVPKELVESIDQNGLINYSRSNSSGLPDLRYSYAYLEAPQALINNPFTDYSLLEMKVDPKRCLLVPLDTLKFLKPNFEIYEILFGNENFLLDTSDPSIKYLMSRFNSDLISLADYKKYYHHELGLKLDKSVEGLPDFIDDPVVIHIGTIPSRFIRVENTEVIKSE